MSKEQKLNYKRFDNSWTIRADVADSGNISATPERISLATLLLIRDDIRTQIGLQREQNRILRTISRKLSKPRKRKIK
jgi:hypothetical protein